MRTRIVIAVLAALALGCGLVSCGSDDGGGTQPRTTGTISGSVLDNTNAQPIAGATATLEPAAPKLAAAAASVVTGADGSFRFNDVAPGTYDVVVDARTVLVSAGNPNVHYALFRIPGNAVTAGQDVVISRPVFMPHIDATQAAQITDNTAANVQPLSIPGLSLQLAAGATTFPGGGKSGELSIVEIPLDRAPVSLPAGMAPTLLFQVEPAGTTFSPAATLTLPNREALPAGRHLGLLSFNPASGQFGLSARGLVAQDGQHITSVAGTGTGGITTASLHAAVCDSHVVSGCVKDQGQQAIAGARVEILSGTNTSDGGRLVVTGATATTDALGNYSIPGVRVCNVWVRATLASASGSGVAQTIDAIQVDGTGQTHVPCLVMTVQTGVVTFSVSGLVRTTGGSPVVGATVQFEGRSCITARAPGADLQRDLISAITDGAGHYLLANVTGQPGIEFQLSAYQVANGLVGRGRGTVPPLAENGSTLNGDITLCTEQQALSACPTGTWTLTSNQLHIAPDAAALVCDATALDVPDPITLQSLTSGVLTLLVQQDRGCGPTTETNTFTRVKGTGPSGPTAGNLPGIYRRTAVDPPDPGTSEILIHLGSNGQLGVISDGNQTLFIEAGIYTLSGSQLTTEPAFNTTDPQPTSQVITVTLTGNSLHLLNADIDITLERCAQTTGTGVQGYWSGLNATEVTVLMIGVEEYAVTSLGSPSPAASAAVWSGARASGAASPTAASSGKPRAPRLLRMPWGLADALR